MTHTVTVYKLDHLGQEVFAYEARVVGCGANWVQIEALFGRDEVDLGPVVFRRGDRFIEWFYSDRWYNIFQVHDAIDDHLKGWYCNVTRPAVLENDAIRADDLALDVWIDPAGRMTLLDEAEFAALSISDEETAAALAAVDELRRAVHDRTPPFHVL